MKNAIISALYFGMTVGFIMGGIIMIVASLSVDISYGAFMGLFVFLSFGLLMSMLGGIFIFIHARKFKKERKLNIGDKELCYEGQANYMTPLEAVGGWIYLTNEKLIFVPHMVNISRFKKIINLVDVKEVRISKTLYVIPNGLQIITNTGRIEHFIVMKNKLWAKEVSKLLN